MCRYDATGQVAHVATGRWDRWLQPLRHYALRSLDFTLMPPVRLHEHAIDLFESDGFGAVAHGAYFARGDRLFRLMAISYFA